MDNKDGKMRWLVCLALVFATLATYWKVTRNGFINFDDDVYVTENPWVNSGLSFSGVVWAFTHFYAANWHPLTWISHMLDCQLFGLNPGPQHAVNVVFHAANAVLVFLLLQRATRALWRSALVAALFALHPLHVESVAWIAERKDLLSAFFGLLALLAYVRYADESKTEPPATASVTSGNQRPKVWYACALVFFACGLMSKPMLVTLPFVMVLLDFWPLQRISSSGATRAFVQCKKLKPLLLEKWPFFAFTLILCVITFCAQKNGGAMMSASHGIGFRIANALVSYLGYIGRMFWPVHLSVIYPFSPLPAWQVSCAGAILLVISFLCAATARRHPYLLCGWLWYLGTLVPVIGLVQVGAQSSADRYTYMPLIGLFIMGVWAADDFMTGLKFRKWIAILGSVAILLSCAAVTAWQIQFWRNGVILFDRALAVTVNNPVAQNDLAAALVAAGDVPEALPHYEEAARLAPDNALIQNNFGAALARDGMTNAAIAHYETAIQIQTNYADAYNNLGVALTGQRDFEDAIFALNRASAIEPDNAGVHENLGAVLMLINRPEDALGQYRQAAALAPRDPAVHLNFGLALLKAGLIPQAAGEFSNAAGLDASSPQAQYQLGCCLAILRQPEAAIAHLREAARLQPDWTEPLNAMAWILATDGNAQIRNGPEAVRLAKSAAAMSRWQQPVILNTLAAAYAETGRFAEATNVAGNAIQLAQQSGQSNLAAQIESLLALYQQGRPFHHQ